MTTWTPDELELVDAAEELRVASGGPTAACGDR